MAKGSTSGFTPSVGDLVAIPLPNGVHAAIWVLELGEKQHVRFVVLDGFWPAMPSAAELAVARASPASSPPLPGVSDVWKACLWGALPLDFGVPATRAFSPADEGADALLQSEGTMVFSDAEALRRELHTHWRLKHDREALFAEWDAASAAREKRKAERRAGLTLAKMLRDEPFAHWSRHWPTRVVREARRIFRDATKALIALDEGGTKRQRVAALKRIVTEFNALYDAEGCIETGEAAEIVARVEELASLVGVSNDDEVLTGHREW
jgi:hypothetical protein